MSPNLTSSAPSFRNDCGLETDFLANLPVLLMGIQHQKVHEGGFSMVHGTQKANVALIFHTEMSWGLSKKGGNLET
jgi:hypothetical protein